MEHRSLFGARKEYFVPAHAFCGGLGDLVGGQEYVGRRVILAPTDHGDEGLPILFNKGPIPQIDEKFDVWQPYNPGQVEQNVVREHVEADVFAKALPVYLVPFDDIVAEGEGLPLMEPGFGLF